MGVQIVHELVGLEAAARFLNRLASPRIAGEALQLTGGLMESQTKGRFDLGVAPDGTPWAPWSEGYAASRAPGQSLLVGTGALRDSIAWSIDGDALSIGSNLVYAAIHQLGGEAGMAPGPAAIPARPYLGLSERDGLEIEDALGGWLAGGAQ